ncbi:hypothetical protein WS96_18270 [Burkholderia sp. MSMB1835]|nr:hypothetical protein WS96_18270 [Burkholderia sp. MSMB1835]
MAIFFSVFFCIVSIDELDSILFSFCANLGRFGEFSLHVFDACGSRRIDGNECKSFSVNITIKFNFFGSFERADYIGNSGCGLLTITRFFFPCCSYFRDSESTNYVSLLSFTS